LARSRIAKTIGHVADVTSPLTPFVEMRTLGPERGVVTVAGVDDGVVAVPAEHLAVNVTEQLLERARLPRLADPARK
jgi:hypothetical protein